MILIRREAPHGVRSGRCVLLLVLGGVLIWWFWPREPDSGLDPDATPAPSRPREISPMTKRQRSPSIDKPRPSVVHVTRLSRRRDPFSLDIASPLWHGLRLRLGR